MTSTPPLRIHLLGRFQVAVNEQVIPHAAWRLRSAAGIVKLLALVADHRLHREQLMEALWPDVELEAAANNLRYSLYTARRIFASVGGRTPYLQRDGASISLAPAEWVWTDVGDFEALLGDAGYRTTRSRCGAR